MKKRPTPTVTQSWGAPKIVTHKTDDCTAPDCLHGPPWSGENAYSGGNRRCRPAPAWDAIVAEAERVGMPISYRRDLYVHDRNQLAQLDPAEPFLWILRACRESSTASSWRTPGSGAKLRVTDFGHIDQIAWGYLREKGYVESIAPEHGVHGGGVRLTEAGKLLA